MQVGNLGYPGRCERGSSRMIKLFLLTRNNAIMCASWRKVAVHCTSSKAVERRKDGCRIKQVQLDEEDVDVTTDDVICDVAWELCVDPAWIANSFTHSACPHPPSHMHARTLVNQCFIIKFRSWGALVSRYRETDQGVSCRPNERTPKNWAKI